jgi:hypothetical protein
MREDVRQALIIGPTATMEERTIDITTTGRRSGEPRRIETAFYRFEDSVYLSGIPGPKPRAWLLNLIDEPNFTFHLKHAVTADLPATGTVITDPVERERILTQFVEEFSKRHTADSPWPKFPLKDWLEHSPLVRVSFEGVD